MTHPKKRPKRQHVPIARIWLNTRRPGLGKTIYIYHSRPHLIMELKQAVADGKRCFVTTNSKALIRRIVEALGAEFPHVKILEITADTRPEAAQRAFLLNPAAEALRYQIILTSPAVSSGVDISFADGAQKIDLVFGFCEALITTHLDFDQQLARVRNPGAVKVWINPRRFEFETNLDAVRLDILQQALYKDLLIDRKGPGGTERYQEDDPLIRLATLVTARDRASKNNLLGNFVEYKRQQGFTVETVRKDEAMADGGKRLLTVGKTIDHQKYAANVLAAEPLRPREFDRLKALIESDGQVTQQERWSLERTRLELFHRELATADLIFIDDRGRYRARVCSFQGVLAENVYFDRLRGDGPLSREDRFLKTDASVSLAITRLLRMTPLLRAGGFDADAVVQGNQLDEFSSFVKENKPALEHQLGIEIRRDLEQKPMQQLAAVLKLIGLGTTKIDTVKKDGKKVYRYRLDRQRLERLQHVLSLRERFTAWRRLAELHDWPAEDSDGRDDEEGA